MEYRESKAIYIQIADAIGENILMQKWKEEERIPSIREMAVSMEVNPNTVLRAYSYLQEEGVIYNKRGIGYFIKDGAKVKVLQLKKNDFINNELPYIFKIIDILHLDFKTLEKLYREYKQRRSA